MPLIETYKAKQLRDGLAPKTVNNHLAVLRKLLNLAADWGELPHAPRIRQLRVPPQAVDFLTFEEAERFLAAAEPAWKPMLLTALKTGLRIGELLALKWEDVDLVVGRLVVRRTVWEGIEGTPKGGSIARGAAVRRGDRHAEGAPAPARCSRVQRRERASIHAQPG